MTLQRSKDAGPFFYNGTDDDWDTVHYFDYTVDSPDYHVAANDYDFKAGFLADHQQVKLTINSYPWYRITVPYRTILPYRTLPYCVNLIC